MATPAAIIKQTRAKPLPMTVGRAARQ